jgi:hypothetical protein
LTDLFEPVIPGVANCAVLKGRWELSLISGGYGEGETPLPISNRAVKPLSADGTWPARARESRTPPVSSPERAARTGRLFCVLAAAGVAPLPRCAARRHAVGLASTWGLLGSSWGPHAVGLASACLVPTCLVPCPGRTVHSHRPACTAPSDGTASATTAGPRGARTRTVPLQRRRSPPIPEAADSAGAAAPAGLCPSGRRVGGTGGRAGRGGAA